MQQVSLNIAIIGMHTSKMESADTVYSVHGLCMVNSVTRTHTHAR